MSTSLRSGAFTGLFCWILAPAAARAAEQSPSRQEPPLEKLSREEAEAAEEEAEAAARTPRGDQPFSGYFFGIEVGVGSLRSGVAAEAGVGPGLVLGLSAAVELWDHLLIGAGGFFFGPSDQRQFSTQVTGCEANGGPCSDYSTTSSVSGGLLRFEVGYQHRFRPFRAASIVPGAWLGYAQSVEDLHRGIVNCVDCPGESLSIRTSGAYVAPFVRVTFGRTGRFALSLRSQWFATGDILQMTLLGAEIGLP